MSAVPTSSVQICNLALARLGQKPISSVDVPTTPVEDLCALHYPMTRRKLLRAYIFNFAKKYAQITVDAGVTPAFGYASAFALPNDFIRLLALGDITVNADTPHGLYDLSEGFIFTDQEDEADTTNILYIKDATLVAKWDTLFVDLMRVQLAKDMAFAFTLKPSLVQAIDVELADIKLQAAAIAGQEKPPRRIQRSKLRDNRRMGGNFRDLTRYPI